MIILLSPAKSIKSNISFDSKYCSQPIFSQNINKIVNDLKRLSSKDLQDLFKVSPQLAQENYNRYQNFNNIFNQSNSAPAILSFNGDVYKNIDTNNFSEQDIIYLKDKVLILSGLYGILRPLDYMQPYRLEMGTELSKNKILFQQNYSNLYKFWQNDVTNYINKMKSDTIINLASNEYFKVINPSLTKKRFIDLIFKDNKNGQLKIIGISSKKARGAMTDYAIKNKISNPNELKQFNNFNYKYNQDLSSNNQWVFVR